jgi:hypothetical protein
MVMIPLLLLHHALLDFAVDVAHGFRKRFEFLGVEPRLQAIIIFDQLRK